MVIRYTPKNQTVEELESYKRISVSKLLRKTEKI